MIEDDVIRGVRLAREAFAQLHGFNIRAMVADLQARDSVGDWLVVSRSARHLQSIQSPNQAIPPTGAAIPLAQGSKSLDTAPTADLGR